MYKFLTALFLAGSALALPTISSTASSTATSDTCHKDSVNVTEWVVHDFDFHASYVWTTPAHQNSWGYVNFTLTNPVLDSKSVCSASSSQISDFFYGNMVYNCDGPVQSQAGSFTFSRPSNDLRINQTWNCADVGSRFSAQGGVKLNLDCKDETWQSGTWEPGQIWATRTITCGKVTVPAPIETLSAVM